MAHVDLSAASSSAAASTVLDTDGSTRSKPFRTGDRSGSIGHGFFSKLDGNRERGSDRGWFDPSILEGSLWWFGNQRSMERGKHGSTRACGPLAMAKGRETGGRESADGDVALAKVRQITARHVLDESGWSTGRLRYPHEDLPYVKEIVLERPAGVCLKTIRGRPQRANEAEPPYPRLGHAIHPYPVRLVVSIAHTTPRTTILSCATASRSPRPYPRPTSRAIPSCIGQHRLGYHPIETGRRTRSIRFRRQRDRKEAFSKGKFHPKLTSVPGSEAIRKTAPTSTPALPWTPTDDSRCLERRGHA